MSIIWWAIWLVLSVFILGIFVWTTQALQKQKAVWKIFADKNKLNYRKGAFFQSSTVTGMLAGNDFMLVSEERTSNDIRGRKFVTVIQFSLPTKMPAPGVIGTGDYRDFVKELQARDSWSVTYGDWTENMVMAKSDDVEKLNGYLTPDRLKVLDTLIKQKNVSVLFLFDTTGTYLRLETVDPILKPGQLDKLVEKIIPMLKVLHV